MTDCALVLGGGAGWSASFDRVCGRFLGAREAIEQTPQQEDCQAQRHSIQKLRANVFVTYLAACSLAVSEQMRWQDQVCGGSTVPGPL